MARQKSEDRIVPQDARKDVPTRDPEQPGGGKAVPVNQQARQLCLPFATAENPQTKVQGPCDQADRDLSLPVWRVRPKAKVNTGMVTPATIEGVVETLCVAFDHVASNRGAPGPDRQTITQVREHWGELLPKLTADLLEGSFQPGMIRRAYIPKAGGQRGLGIPNVVDRVVQEAVRRVLEPLYEPTFHESSHGFRPGRSCHTALTAAVKHLQAGYGVVVDLDLEKFFDRVCHQRLMARLAQRVTDHRLLVLIGRMLKAKVIMPDGVAVRTEEGVPQGGPLSPLLSNVVLDELDRELDRRGLRFVRYADDVNVFVRSERAGMRVMGSLRRFIEGRLRLKVNEAKSAVARPEERHFLGFRLRARPQEEGVEILLSERTTQRIKQRVLELTPRNWGRSLSACIAQVSVYLKGWFEFFGVCTAHKQEDLGLGAVDAHIRRRLRAIQLKHWKRKRSIARKLIQLGVYPKTAWRGVYQGRRSLWSLSHSHAVDRGLRNAYFAERGLVSLLELWRAKHQPVAAPVLNGQMEFAWG